MLKYENEIRTILMARMPKVYKEDIGVDIDLTTIGMDSITFINIVGAIEDDFDIEFPDEKLIMEESSTIYKLCNIVQICIESNETK